MMVCVCVYLTGIVWWPFSYLGWFQAQIWSCRQTTPCLPGQFSKDALEESFFFFFEHETICSKTGQQGSLPECVLCGLQTFSVQQ